MIVCFNSWWILCLTSTMHCNGFYNLGVNSQVQKKTKFAFLARQATCKKMGVFADTPDTPLSQYFNLSRQFRKIDHQNWRHPCFIWGKGTGTKLAAKLKIQAKTTISKTARFFYLIFAWELLLNTYRGPGCAQFEWTIFLNRRVLLKRCE